MESRKKVIVLQIDGLRPSMLGPYGNTWFETPNFNRLASESVMFEQCYTVSPELDPGSRSLMSGIHPCQKEQAFGCRLTKTLDSMNLQSTYITDRKDDLMGWRTESFDRIMTVWPDEKEEATIDLDRLELCELTSFFAQSISAMNDQPDTDLFWLDAIGMLGAWDAPFDFRCRLADEEDPEPARFVEAPSCQFNPISDDPDLLLSYQQAYGGQVVLLDYCLGILLDYLDELESPPLFCLTSSRGYPLGEHGVVGFYRHILNNESIHVPCFVRWPDGSNRLVRRQDLALPSAVQSIVANWLSRETSPVLSQSKTLESTSFLPNKSEQAILSVAGTGSERIGSIQTHAWKYIRGSSKKLFVRPDDLWEFNDVTSRCGEIVDQLDRLLDCGIANLEAGNPLLAESLARELAFGVN